MSSRCASARPAGCPPDPAHPACGGPRGPRGPGLAGAGAIAGAVTKLQQEDRTITDIAKTKAGAKVAPDIDQIAKDVAALRSDFGRLLGSLRHEYSAAGRHGADMAEDAVRRVGNGVTDVYQTLADQGDRSARMVDQYVRGKPLVTILLGAAIGLVAGRLLSR